MRGCAPLAALRRVTRGAVCLAPRLKESDASVWYFLGVNSLCQIGFGLLLVFSVFIHFPGTPSLSPSELPAYLWHGTQCFIGVQVRGRT